MNSNNIKSFKEFLNEEYIEPNNNYMLGKVTMMFLKKQSKLFHVVKFEDIEKRKNIFLNRKSDIKLSEFQNLFDYWNFCDKNEGRFDLAHNDIGRYKPVIGDWVWYLILCQLFPNEMKNTTGNSSGNDKITRDLYTQKYEQILSLPKLTGILDEDKKLFHNVMKYEFFASDSPVRNGLILYYIYYKGNNRLF